MNKNHEIKNMLGEVLLNYDLGNLLFEPKYEITGSINYNYHIKTTKGDYMIRAAIEKKLFQRKNIEYNITNHLINKNFKYQIPSFLKNKSGGNNIILKDILFDVYERLPGEIIKGSLCGNVGVVKLIASYHKAINSYSRKTIPSPHNVQHDSERKLEEKLLRIKKNLQNPKDNSDIITNKYIDLIIESNNFIINNTKINKPSLFIHGDFNYSNILYQNNKPTGLIDFGNVKWGSKERDLIEVIGEGNFKTVKKVLEVYNSVYSISNNEAHNILAEGLISRMGAFKWAYQGMTKNLEKREELLEKIGKNIQKLFNNYKLSLR